MSSNNPDFPPFLNLNKEVELAILKQLRFRDYLNLAQTCRKWYNIVCGAPRSMKRTVLIEIMNVSYHRFEKEVFMNTGDEFYGNWEYKPFPLSVHNKFDLVNIIHCHSLRIEHGFLREDLDPAVEYLVLNADKFYFDNFIWVVQREGCINEELLAILFDFLSHKIIISVAGDEEDREIDSTKRNCISKVLEENRMLEEIFCSIEMPTKLFTTVVKQVVTGDRPKLETFECSYKKGFPEEDPWFKDFIQRELPKNLKSEKESKDKFCYTLSTSDSREMTVEHYFSEGYITFSV